jgi:hypothetical protein
MSLGLGMLLTKPLKLSFSSPSQSDMQRESRIRPYLWPALLLGALLTTLGCSRSHALAVRPDMAATWDVMQDDFIDVEVQAHGDIQRARMSAAGGHVVLHDAGAMIELDIDCARPEIACPQEVLSRELRLDNRTGDVSDDGDKFLLSFAGQGSGPCRLQPESVASADLETRGSPVAQALVGGGTQPTSRSPLSKGWYATAMTGGNVALVFDAACFGSGTGLPSDAQVVLSTGFTAARR